MSSLYLPPPEHLEYLIDRRPPRRKQAAMPDEPAWPFGGIASDAERPRPTRRWMVIG